MRAWPRDPDRADALLAAALLGLSLASVAAVPGGAGSPSVVTWIALVALTVPLAVRHRAPAAVLAIVGAASVAVWWTGATDGPTAVAGGIAIHGVGRHLERPASVRAFAPVAAVLIAGAAAVAVRDGTAEAVFTFAARCSVVLGPFWLGDGQRARAALTDSYRERVDRAERERQEAMARAVIDERGRIARELHDVVGHSVSVIAVQAMLAERLADRDPDGSRTALAHVGQVARTTLGEMRRIVDVLDGEEARTGFAPQPSLDDLPDLVERCRATGLDVQLSVTGRPADLPPLLQLTVYRIVQEGLTNVLNHAPGALARARVDACGERSGVVVVEVIDDGGTAATTRTAPARAGARGIVGMRERVHAWRGELQAGPLPDRGFALRATMLVET